MALLVPSRATSAIPIVASTAPETASTLYRPVRETICPEVTLAAIIAKIIGTNSMPDEAADIPSTPCR